MILVYFDLLKPNPEFILPLRPLIFEKMVGNREKSLKIIVKIRIQVGRLGVKIFL